jgi:shikimate kinase
MKIFLIGFMGSGKTYWGKIWAKQNLLLFFDLDEVIEEQEKKTIADIFEVNGEDYFREKETMALKTFAGMDNCIIACGGGTACFNNNMQWMNDNGTTVYLSATPQYIYNRVFEEKGKRPLFFNLDKDELASFIENKLKEREPFYRQAKIIVPVEGLNEKSAPAFITYNS